MAFCGNCGIKLTDEAKFCPQCGKKVSVFSPSDNNKIENLKPEIQSTPSLTDTLSSVTDKSTPAKINWVLVSCIIAVTTMAIIFVPKIINNQNENSTIPNVSLAMWEGYSTYESFAKAADIDEFLGRPLTEQGFRSLMALTFFAQDDDKLSVDIVSGAKLSERYNVSETLRHNYNYLVKRSGIKGTTYYIAYFNGESWIVIYGKEE